MIHFSLTRNKPPIIVADGPLYIYISSCSIVKFSFKNPTFIVTLDGVEGQKKAAAGQQKKDAPPAAATVAPEEMSDASKVMAAFKFKPTTAATPPSKEALAAPSTTPTQVSANGNKSEVRSF